MLDFQMAVSKIEDSLEYLNGDKSQSETAEDRAAKATGFLEQAVALLNERESYHGGLGDFDEPLTVAAARVCSPATILSERSLLAYEAPDDETFHFHPVYPPAEVLRSALSAADSALETPLTAEQRESALVFAQSALMMYRLEHPDYSGFDFKGASEKAIEATLKYHAALAAGATR
jgi:hypothetical protein